MISDLRFIWLYFKGYNTKGEKNGMYGKNHAPESIKKMSDAKMGCKGLSGKLNPNYGKIGANAISVSLFLNEKLIGTFPSIRKMVIEMNFTDKLGVNLMKNKGKLYEQGYRVEKMPRMAG